jgi:hypothetical protein
VTAIFPKTFFPSLVEPLGHQYTSFNLRLAALGPPSIYPWLTRLLAPRPFKVVAIALANKMARVASAPKTRQTAGDDNMLLGAPAS